MSQISKKAGFGIKAITLVLLILNFNVVGAFASEKHEITPQIMLEFTNASRREAGAIELTSNAQLAVAAQAKASDMFEFQYFDHNSPSGTTPWYWIKSSGYEYSYAGENLAIDFISAEGTHQAFMNSSSHRENILNTNYEEIGIAVKKGMFEGVESIIVVEEFGSPLSVKVPAVSVPEARSGKPIEVKNINISEAKNKKISINMAPSIQVEKIEEVAVEVQDIPVEDTDNQTEDAAMDESVSGEPEPGSHLFIDYLYYPDTVFEKEKACLGVIKEETSQNVFNTDSASSGKVARNKLLADNHLAKKYENFISSLDSFENKAILFLLSITMTMNLVYISSGESQEDDG